LCNGRFSVNCHLSQLSRHASAVSYAVYRSLAGMSFRTVSVPADHSGKGKRISPRAESEDGRLKNGFFYFLLFVNRFLHKPEG